MTANYPSTAEIRARLDAVRVRHAKATGGRWGVDPEGALGPDTVASECGGYEHVIGNFYFGDGDSAEADREFTLNAHADVADLLALLDLYVGHEPTLTEEALYVHGEKVRSEIADDLHRADVPTFAATEDPVLVVKTTRAIDVRLVSDGTSAPYYVAPQAGDQS
jgi:hypothetical protein